MGSARVADSVLFAGEFRRAAAVRHRWSGATSRSAGVKQGAGSEVFVVLIVRRGGSSAASPRRRAAAPSSPPVVVLLAGYAVGVGVEVVGVAQVPLELSLSRLLRTEALTIVLVGLGEGWGGWIGYLLPGHPEGKAASEHEEGDDEHP